MQNERLKPAIAKLEALLLAVEAIDEPFPEEGKACVPQVLAEIAARGNMHPTVVLRRLAGILMEMADAVEMDMLTARYNHLDGLPQHFTPPTDAAEAVARFDHYTVQPLGITLGPSFPAHLVHTLPEGIETHRVPHQAQSLAFWWDLSQMRKFLLGELELPQVDFVTGPIPDRGAMDEDD